MKVIKVLFARLNILFVLAALALGQAGCKTTDNAGVMEPPPGEQDTTTVTPRLHPTDTVTITFTGPEGINSPQEKPIKDDGTITLPDIGSVQAAGKTPGELEDLIHSRYVPAIYTHLNVTVKTTSARVYFVRGEVRTPNRFEYVGPISVTKAITSAGDFSEYANRKKVILTRANGKRFVLNCVRILDGKDPDPPVYPGDQIEVKRRVY